MSAANPSRARRPRVVVEPGADGRRWFAQCIAPGCAWSYSNVVKSDVQTHATYHRQSPHESKGEA